MIRAAFSLLLCLLVFTACEKDPRYMSPQKYLSQAPWKLTFSQAITTEAGSASDTEDYFFQMDNCQQDIRYFFASNGSYYAEPGAQRCPGQDLGRKDLGRWKYEADTKKLLIEGTGSSGRCWNSMIRRSGCASPMPCRIACGRQPLLRNVTTSIPDK